MDLLSVVNARGVAKRPTNYSNASAAPSALVELVGYRSTNLEKLSMITIIMLFPNLSGTRLSM